MREGTSARTNRNKRKHNGRHLEQLMMNDEEDDDFEIGMIRHDMDQVVEEAEQQLEPLLLEEAGKNSGGTNPPASQNGANSSRGNEECSEPTTNQIETNPQTPSHNIPHATVTDTVASEPNETNEASNTLVPKKWKHQGSHPLSNLTSDLTSGIKTRSSLQNHCAFEAFISQIEPTNITMALSDEYWVTAMQEELEQFERNKVWHLVPRPSQRTVIGTRWVYRNKLDDVGEIVRNKARLVVQGFNQQEGIDYDETFAPDFRMRIMPGVLWIEKAPWVLPLS
ncbi:uncharacterized protein LOC141631565 [Silene latifolia]|uniref:uncharacterized protein LOC141631565 n=1 Tax=Silene latifolia TaxID=37657 RepID=UPI003D77A2E6